MEHKLDKGGKEVPLTDFYKRMISDLRDGADRIIKALHDVLRMLGQTDLNESSETATSGSNLPVTQGISTSARTAWTKQARLLIDAITRVRDRDWNTSRWEDDVQLLKEPFGTDWEMDLWTGLHELMLNFGLPSGAFRPVYAWGITWRIFFERNESTWPAQGPDPREHIEVFRTIDNYVGGFTGMRNEIISIERSHTPTGTLIFNWLGEASKAYYFG